MAKGPKEPDTTAPTAKASPGPPWENVDPKKGLSTWMALYHFVDPVRAVKIYDYAAHHPHADPDTTSAIGMFRIRGGIDGYHGAKTELIEKLKSGELVARGFVSSAPPDAPRQAIHKDRWADLDLNIRTSEARATGLVVSQILVFASDAQSPAFAAARKQYVPATLRHWYLKRVEDLTAANERSSREQDYVAALTAFAGNVPRRKVEALRRELAPASWKLGGRPRKE